MRKLLFGIMVAAIISGCAFSNEGKVDYRRTDKRFHITETDDNGNDIDYTHLQELVVRSYSLGDGTKFKAGDALSLHLRTAFIKEFSEEWLSSIATKAFTSHWGQEDGEIVILANAFEETEGKELDFKDMQAGRVVFYSDDVLEGQFLNFDNMPIYGPLTYEGAPFAFRISILELDVVSEQTKAMLETIAKVGAVAYPPASPVLGVLNGLGGALMDGPQTDTGFRYTIVLDPRGGSEHVNHLALEVGSYVLARVENRDEFIPWDEIILDENLDKLYWRDKRGDNGKRIPYTDNTYLVVEINKDVSNINVELAQNNFAGLISSLQEKDRQRAASWRQTQNTVMKVAIKRTQISNFSNAKKMIKDLGKDDSIVSKVQKRIKTEKLFTMIANSVDDEGKVLVADPANSSESFDLSDLQIKYLLSSIINVAESNMDENTIPLFTTKSILEIFRGPLINKTRTPDLTKKKQILDLVAPM